MRSPPAPEAAFGALGVLERLDEREQPAPVPVGVAHARLLRLALHALARVWRGVTFSSLVSPGRRSGATVHELRPVGWYRPSVGVPGT